jgi:thiamine biosynthesis lipoprotein ApbE
VGLVTSWGCVEPGHVERRWEALGDPAFAKVHTSTARDADPVVDDVQQAVSGVEDWLRPDGLLGRLNEGATSAYYEFPDEQHDFYRCVLLALDYAKASRGAFDPTVGPLTRLYRSEAPRVPRQQEIDAALSKVGWEQVNLAGEARAIHYRTPGMELDLGGVVKGFALDLAARAFSRPGTRAGLLQLGGNLYAWGEPPGEEEWTVGIPDPRHRGRELIRLRTTNRGVAVSGQRDPGEDRPFAAPILDPSTGRPVAGRLLAAVAVADSGADADAMSTALFAAGFHRAGELLSRTRRVEAVLLVEDDDAAPYFVASTSLEGRLQLPPEIDEETGGRVRYLLPPESIDLPF